MYIQLEHSSFVLVPQRHNAVPAATVLGSAATGMGSRRGANIIHSFIG